MTQNGSPGERSPEREELVEGIERTRQDLAETVEALAAKADVPTRVRGKATEVRERVTGTFATLTDTAREKAPQGREAIPEPARRTTEKAVRAAGERPAVLYAVAGAFTVAGLWMWRLRRRS
jgi:hypothetical protein